ncbi:MAG TPA: DUF6318 family protein [Marmoricola sp.]|nr:DUF6318 family protein [Marmoricola sp.]
MAFVHHVIDVLNYSASTLDAQAIAHLATADCRACEAIVTRTNKIRQAGGRIVGGAWTPVESTALGTGNTGERQVQVVVDYAPQKVLETTDADVIRHPGGRTVYTFDVERHGSKWRLQGVQGVAQG